MSKETRFSARMRLLSDNDNATVVVEEGGADGNVDELIANQGAQASELNEAYERGARETEARCQAQIQDLSTRLEEERARLPATLSAYFEELERQIKEEVCELAFSVAEIIIRDEIKSRSDYAGLIGEALGPVLNLRGVKVHLNPEVLTGVDPEGLGLPPGVELTPDPGLGPGEALVECSQGLIDATVKGRLATLKESVKKHIAGKTDDDAENA